MGPFANTYTQTARPGITHRPHKYFFRARIEPAHTMHAAAQPIVLPLRQLSYLNSILVDIVIVIKSKIIIPTFPSLPGAVLIVLLAGCITRPGRDLFKPSVTTVCEPPQYRLQI